MEIPIQAARRNDDTFLLKFRPIIAGDYSIVLKDFIEQPIPGCPFIFPVYNPSAVHLEAFNRFQPINDCHLICTSTLRRLPLLIYCPPPFLPPPLGNVDRAGPGNLFVMVYSQAADNSFQPASVPLQIQPRPSNHIRISLSPAKLGTYRIYLAYRNIPINGRLSLLSIILDY